jgi:hypothetical protein
MPASMTQECCARPVASAATTARTSGRMGLLGTYDETSGDDWFGFATEALYPRRAAS